MRTWLSLGLAAAVLVIGGSACGAKESQGQSDDWMLAFQGDQNGEWAMFAVGLDGGEAVRIDGPELPGFEPPIPSPDGKSLILPEPYGLIVMRTDGSGKQRLPDGAAQGAWSPDGRRLAFVVGDGGISISEVDGSHVRRLTDSDSDSSPSWSPDGERIAFTRGIQGELRVIDADGENERELGYQPGALLHWSPDGNSISFIDGDRGLVTVSVDDGRVLARVKRDFSFGDPAWSSDGGQIAYTRWGSRRGQIRVMKADGTGETTITSPAESASAPLWSPDGHSIVYERHSPLGGIELWEVRLADRKTRRLTALYPNGANVLGTGAAWIRGPVRAVQAPEPKVLPQKNGAVLENPQPIFDLAASDSLVAVVPPDRIFGTQFVLAPPLVLWDPIRTRLDRLSLASCWGPTGVVLNREQVGYTCLGGHAASVGSSVQAFALDGSRPESYFAGAYGDGVPDDALAGRIAGAGHFLYFTERKLRLAGDVVASNLWRVGQRGKTVIATGPDAGEPAAADGDRLAVERDDGVVTLMDSGGGVLGRISPGGGVITETPTWDPYPPATVDLDGPDLVVLRNGLLQRYDSHSLKLVRSWRVPADSQLGGLADGIAGYAAGDAVHVLRLGDGAETVVPVRAGHITATDLTSAGLFYAVNTQSVRYGYVQIEKNAPSRIVFVQWKELLRRLR